MSTFKKFSFSKTSEQNELMMAFLGELNFDSFEEINSDSFIGYLDSSNYHDEFEKEIKSLSPLFDAVVISCKDMPNKNWNEVWEKSFHPIDIDGKCTVRAPFHPEANTEHIITIEPKMAFGTGHHATTYMMIEFMLDIDFSNLEVLDFGCGTGILSVLAEQKNARSIFANDIEEAAITNAKEICSLNNCNKVQLAEGGMEVVPSKKYNIVLANVNALAITQNIEGLVTRIAANGLILFSGILKEQESEMIALFQKNQLEIIEVKTKDNWVAIKSNLKNK